MAESSPSALEFDVVVLGSGAGGLAAATVAAHEGASVLLVEKEPLFGGSTAISGGVVWIPDNPEMAKLGLPDSKAAARRYLAQVLGNHMREDLVDAFLDNGPDMVRYMHQHTALRLVPREVAPDYYTALEGAAHGGRSMDPQVYDGRRLGRWFRKLRAPLPSFLVLGGMVGRKEIDHLLGTFRSLANFGLSVRLIGSFLRDRMTHGRGTRLLAGNALAAQLLKSAVDAGVTLWSEATVTELVREDGRVRAVKLRKGGQALTVSARRGVVLAGGGAAANSATMRALLATPEQHFTMAPSGSRGDLHALAGQLGARVDNQGVDPANYTPVSVLRDARGREEARFPHLFLDRAKPGLIAVKSDGRRFVDEAGSYHQFVQGMLAVPAGGAVPAWLVCDAAFLRRYGMGLVRPGIPLYRRYLKSGYLRCGKTVAALAEAIGVPAAGLEEEVRRHNIFARDGVDPDFGKGGNIYDRHQGDLTHQPNPCLGPIATAPYYAVAVYPGDIGATRGLITDASARVLDGQGAPIPGLYACGNDMNSVMAGTYPGAGITLGPALTFGYIIGRELGTAQA